MCRIPALLAVLAALLAACAPAPREPALPVPRAAPYRQVLTPEPLLPLVGEGAVLLRFAGERESGSLRVEATRRPAVQLQLRARITGTLALDLRFDDHDLLVLDYANEQYFAGPNTSAVRYELFSLDFTPQEFLILLTGRVPRRLFDAGRGERPQPDALTFATPGGSHRMTLDDHGLPAEWVKTAGGRRVYRVAFRSYNELPFFPGEPPLRLPRQVRVFLEDGDGPVLVLGLRDLRFGGPEAIRLTARPDPAWQRIVLRNGVRPPDTGS